MNEALWLLAQKAGQPVWMRLDSADKARVVLALGAVVILGFGLIVLAWLAARATRRYMDKKNEVEPPRRQMALDDWASKPLTPPLDDPRSGGDP